VKKLLRGFCALEKSCLELGLLVSGINPITLEKNEKMRLQVASGRVFPCLARVEEQLREMATWGEFE